MISLVQSDEDLIKLPKGHADAIAQWLADGEDAANGAHVNLDMRRKAAKAVERALGSGDKAKSEKAVQRAMGRAFGRWQSTRRALKEHLAANSSESLRGLDPLDPLHGF